VKIDKKLNLVSTINRDGALPVYLHVLPFPYEVVEEHCFLLGNLFNNFITQIGGIGAARVAAMMLRKKLKEQGASEGPGLLDEMQRLASVVYNDGSAWKVIPLDTALKQQIVLLDEYREVEGEIVFYGFLCHSETGTDSTDGGGGDRHVRWATHCIERYGIPRFLADVESGYRYPDPECPAGNIIHTLLDWASNEGFWRVIREISDAEFSSPAQYRQRFIISALKDREASMAAKTIVEIDVNDEKFQAFIEKFNEYQAALKGLPEAWRGSAQGIADTGNETATSQKPRRWQRHLMMARRLSCRLTAA
jgi:hypothetical protein